MANESLNNITSKTWSISSLQRHPESRSISLSCAMTFSRQLCQLIKSKITNLITNVVSVGTTNVEHLQSTDLNDLLSPLQNRPRPALTSLGMQLSQFVN